MVDNLTERVQGSRNKFEELVAKIPGYRGYKQKEERREADKLLRLHIARQYDEQLARLNELQFALTSSKRLDLVVVLERAATKLQLLIDRLKTASYGYAGLFDAVKVDEDVLDRMYDFDEGMLAGVDQLSALLDTMFEAVASEALTVVDANKLVSQLDALNNTFSQRQDIILEA
ncbi:MAG: hypothetical protein GX552_11250 [Chloroflexi bacterium]|jgi:hypothetical protein|nr:hypothetical protein [Chloroflexota bacterium]